MTVVEPPPTLPRPRFDHLLGLSDEIGTFEHAEYTRPRRDHGYCTDDMARVLVVVLREPSPTPAVRALGRTALRFLVGAQELDGTARNRRDAQGRWRDRPGVDDCWGRSVAAFGAAAHRSDDEWIRQTGMASFDRAVEQRSEHVHAMAFAGMGAAEVLRVDPGHDGARALLHDVIDTIGALPDDPAWPWVDVRLTYANATVAEGLLAAGQALHRPDVVERGCLLLGWLLDRETVDGHLSPTPVGGSGPGDRAPMFDQQPIEAAAMADACARAESITGDPRWGGGVDLAIGWFLGDNDVGATMYDATTGGGYDGLHARGPNRNQGAESTIALVSTLQLGHRRLLATR
jgi:hypothetical protein